MDIGHRSIGSETDVRQKACLDRLRASIWDPFGQPKSIPNRSKGRQDGHWIVDIDFEGWHPVKAELVGTPNPAPSTRLYILESRARFARAQFSLPEIQKIAHRTTTKEARNDQKSSSDAVKTKKTALDAWHRDGTSKREPILAPKEGPKGATSN